MPHEPCIRVLLADTNLTFLEAATRFLALDENLALVGRAVTGADTLRQAAHLGPDLLLIDIRLEDMNGLEVARQIKGWPDPPRVVVLALGDDDEYLKAARNAGADGFVAKMEFYPQLYCLLHAWFAEPVVPGYAADSNAPAGGGLAA